VGRVLIKADSRFPVNRKRLRQTIKKILTVHSLTGEVEVSLLVAGDRKMKALNQRYRKKDKTVSVLSFPLEKADNNSSLGFASSPDGILRLGDIVISYPQAQKRAAEHNVLVDEEIDKLVEHGMRYLLGIS